MIEDHSRSSPLADPVTSVDVISLQIALSKPFAFSQPGLISTRGALIVRLRTESGLTGYGEGACFGFQPSDIAGAVVKTVLRPLLLNRPISDSRVLFWTGLNRLRDFGIAGATTCALSAVDMALWDLRGKALGSSIADLLGGRFRSDVEAYVTSFYSDDSGPRVSESAAKAVDYMAAGYTAFKVKIGFGIARDVELVSAIREAVGDGPKILVDANRGYTFALAKRLIGPMSALRVEWIEEPLALTEVHGYELLRSVSQDVLIAGGEGEATVLGFWPLLEMGLVDVLQPDLGVAGGFTGVLPIVELAQRTGQIVCPHVWGTVIGQAAALQMLACIPDTPLSRGGYQPMFEYDLSEHPFRTELSADRLQAVDGRISIPSGPGLGLTVDDDALERLAKCSWT